MLHCSSLAGISILSLDRFGPELRNNNAVIGVIIAFTNKVVGKLGYGGAAGILYTLCHINKFH